MSAFTTVFSDLIEQVLDSVKTAYPARVLSYDIESGTATIQPLFKVQADGVAQATGVLEEIPVLQHNYQTSTDGSSWGVTQHFRPVLDVGDVVWCQVAHRSLDHMESGEPYNPGRSRIMNMQDSVIIGVVMRP